MRFLLLCGQALLACACTGVAGLDDLTFGGANAAGGAAPSGATASATGGASASAGGGGAAATSGSGGSSGPMSDADLLVRYYLDDDLDGSTPTVVVDAAASPLPLGIDYGAGNMSFDGVQGRRGLRWAVAASDGGAGTPIGGTKVAALEGVFALTYEAVLQLTEASTGDTRIIDIGTPTAGSFSLLTDSPSSLKLRMSGAFPARWGVDLTTRVVIHMVYDSQQPAVADRARLYVDGQLRALSGGSTVALNDPVTVSAVEVLSLGNRSAGSRSSNGTLSYAAIYTAALDDAIIATHAAILSTDDDTPQ